MKKWFVGSLVSVMTLAAVATAIAQESGQVFFRGGAGILTGGDRGNEAFTDARGATRRNDSDTGFSVGAGIDHTLFKDPWFGNTVLAQIMLDYAQFSRERVTRPTGVLGLATNPSKVTVNELAVVAAPKYRIDMGQVRPWIIPVGLEFLVISPPSNDTNYLDLGLNFGAGIEYRLIKEISVGLDFRYHFSFNTTNARSVDFVTTGVYIGFNY